MNDTAAHLDRLAIRIERLAHCGGGKLTPTASGLPGLAVIRRTQPTNFEAAVYSPVLCLILQGSKETTIGERSITVGRGQMLVVSHDLPVISRILEASPDTPYLAIVLPIDLNIVRGLYTEIDDAVDDADMGHSLDVDVADDALIDAIGRYLDIFASPREAAVLAPLIQKEIHFRVLTARNGGMLRQLLYRDSHASRISKAIMIIRRDYRVPISIPELARSVGMSQSSFHERFRAVTGTTPLRYHKDLRLIEARQLLVEGRLSVAATAFEVGYESATQFSREYHRKFGCSPRQDFRKAEIAI